MFIVKCLYDLGRIIRTVALWTIGAIITSFGLFAALAVAVFVLAFILGILGSLDGNSY